MDVLGRLPGLNNASRAADYSTVPTTSTPPTAASSIQDVVGNVLIDRNGGPRNASGAHPSLSRFLANFTLGFADGLTVPFALTAGLSSLGQTNTVIYAGLAEICAGCISMGIGGYLAAKGEQRSENNTGVLENDDDDGDDDDDDDDEEKTLSLEALGDQNADAVENYLAPLQLPSDLLQSVMAHIKTSSPEIVERIHVGHHSRFTHGGDEPAPEPVKASPAISGLTVALGYLLGGLLPLSPYFFVNNVTSGLSWSFGLCIIALFIFGFAKEYALHINSIIVQSRRSSSRTLRRRLLKWDLMKRGIWEGVVMAALGGIAAVTAVVCVKLFEDVVT
ncbi:Ccc1 family [Xylaria sp. CBS 124048]|nr:Ccc1 family [Xylaria sp. CBS 124048]